MTSLVDEVTHCLAPPFVRMPEVLKNFLEKNDFGAAHDYLQKNPQYLNSVSTKTTPLIQAVKKSKKDVIQKWLALGADVNACNQERETPLHIAVELDDFKIVELLVHHGASVNAQSKIGSSPLMLVLNGWDSIKILQLLLKHHADVNFQDIGGCSALIRIIMNHLSHENVTLLLKHGANVHLRTKKGCTALNLVQQYTIIYSYNNYQKRQVKEALLKAGAR